MVANYAKALLAHLATQMCEVIAEVAKDEADPIVLHRLAEVAAECEWVRKNYGGQ